ncbi:Mov34/MPN/PAD-1 family protein [Candidatus Woesearchaeota archaeon]|nr:Mov34/MPN/PAD-1 family protein [Candidatus Woesearchaeota archaeon]
MVKVVIRKPAFISMVVACVEVYKKEAFGILFGTKDRRDFVVKNCLYYQSVRRDYLGVDLDKRRDKVITYALENISTQKVLGDFHSHAGSHKGLSPADIREIKREKNPLSVLVYLNKTSKKQRWKQNRDKTISGSVGSKFYVNIAAYGYDKKKKVKKLKVVCPYIKELRGL